MTMAHTMDKSSMKELQEIFTNLDSDGAGTVSLVDLKDALKRMHSDKHLTDETLEKLFHGIDVDHSGQIHYQEFLAAIVESQGLITMEHLADAFDRLDGDEKGYISRRRSEESSRQRLQRRKGKWSTAVLDSILPQRVRF